MPGGSAQKVHEKEKSLKRKEKEKIPLNRVGGRCLASTAQKVHEIWDPDS
jgi:hypothetical protein